MEEKAITTQPFNSLPPSYREIETLPAPDAPGAASVIIITFVMFSGITASIYTFISKHRQSSFNFNPRSRVLCYRCRYFSNGNPYLKCALHPVNVLTEQAVDCIDYCPNSKTKRVEG